MQSRSAMRRFVRIKRSRSDQIYTSSPEQREFPSTETVCDRSATAYKAASFEMIRDCKSENAYARKRSDQ